MQRHRCDRCGMRPAGPVGDRCACGGALVLSTRCAWCTAWVAGGAGSTCPRCTAEVLPLHDFGAARMLVDGGVDRYALGERVRGLSREQHSSLGAVFDVQWSGLQVRLEEARWVDRHLVTRCLTAEIEDLLIRLVPCGPETLAGLTGAPRPPFDDLSRLREIADESPIDPTRRMAAIALVHSRRATASDEEMVWSLAEYDDGPIGDEARLSLARWWMRLPPRRHGRALERLRPLLDDPELGPWAAVAAARLAGDEDRAALEPGLRAALAARSEDLRFAAALALGDESILFRARTAVDPEVRSRALRALASCGSESIAVDLATGSDETRLDILRGLAPPIGPALLDALLAAIEAAGPELRRDIVWFLRSRRFTQLEPTETERIAGWIERAVLPVAAVLELLGWATEPAEGLSQHDHPRDDDEIRPFAVAAGAALARATTGERDLILREQRGELARWMFAASPAEVAPIADGWLAEAEPATAFLQEVVLLHARLNGWGHPPDDRALEHLFGVIDRAPTDETRAGFLASALAAERGASGREKIVAGLWQRFVLDPARRRALFIAGAPFRHELKELRRADGDSGPFAPARDPAGFFAALAAADPLDAPALAREAVEASEAAGPPPVDLVDAVVDHAATMLSTHPCTMLWALASVASPVANSYRADPGHAVAIAAVDALRRGWTRLLPTLAALDPIDEAEARHEHLREQIETELRLIAEAEQRRAEELRREEDRRATQARQEAEEGERARQQAALEEELRLERERADRERAAWIAAQSPVTGAFTRPFDPADGGSSYDDPLLPDEPLRSIGAYARFLHAVSAGGDVMALLRRHEMTPERWAACATAWSQLIASRPDLAHRFSQLYAALAAPP